MSPMSLGYFLVMKVIQYSRFWALVEGINETTDITNWARWVKLLLLGCILLGIRATLLLPCTVLRSVR